MSRRKGFSLVELLIVLAVIAALIATITPVALNAIRKAKATQVAQNLKTLASALENAAYVNGVASNKIQSSSGHITLADLGRDIKVSEYGVAYTMTTGGTIQAVIFAKVDADKTEVEKALNSVKEATATESNTVSFTMADGTTTKTYADLSERPTGSEVIITNGTKLIYYSIEFTIY